MRRSDAIQSFVSQETPMRLTDADGAMGTGYSATIGTGGGGDLAAARFAAAAPDRPRGRNRGIWRDLMFSTHTTTVGAITSLALATIDTALWDLRCRRAGLPQWRMAGGA